MFYLISVLRVFGEKTDYSSPQSKTRLARLFMALVKSPRFSPSEESGCEPLPVPELGVGVGDGLGVEEGGGGDVVGLVVVVGVELVVGGGGG